AWLISEFVDDPGLGPYAANIARFAIFVGALFMFLQIADTRLDSTGDAWGPYGLWLIWVILLVLPWAMGFVVRRSNIVTTNQLTKPLAWATLGAVTTAVVGFAFQSDLTDRHHFPIWLSL